jgi:hypothetical protein
MGGLGRGFIHFADELVMNSDAMSHIYLFFLSFLLVQLCRDEEAVWMAGTGL